VAVPALVSTHGEIMRVVASITYPGVAFALDFDSGSAILEVVSTTPHARRSRPWLIKASSNEAEIIRTIFLAVLEFEAERVRRDFKVDDEPIYGDQDIGGMIELARRTAAYNEAVERAQQQLRRQGVRAV
jgi:hypothetical protein